MCSGCCFIPALQLVFLYTERWLNDWCLGFLVTVSASSGALIALPLASGELSIPSGTLRHPGAVVVLGEGTAPGVGSGLGWGNVSHFPCLQLAYPLRLISLTLYFSFSLIVSTGPSGHKSYLSQVARAAPGRWALSQVPLLGTDETWSEECGVWASRFCFISKARRNGLVGFVVVVAFFLVFWILIRFFKCFAHLLFRDYELLPYYSRSF